ncbi:MAG: EAL domain-containing protein [Thermoanaerobaculia bacterium]|nr:EAL domain-containing protein [Thermoanaerobaculia bacterium]
MSLTIFSFLLTGLAIFLLGVVTMVRERFSSLSRRFQLMTLATALWLGCVAFMISSTDPEEALRWSRASYLGIALLPVTILSFILTFRRERKRIRRWIPFAWIVSLIFAVLFQATDLFLEDVKLHPWGYYTQLKATAAPFVLYFVALLGTGLLVLWKMARRTRARTDEKRLRTLLLALGVGSLALIDFLPSFGLSVFPVGFVAAAGFLLLAARTLWKYRLVEIGAGFAAEDVLATIQDAVLVTDFEDRVRRTNPAALRLLAWTEEELIGQDLSKIVISPFHVGSASDTLVRGGSIRNRTMVWRRADGRKVEVEVTAFLIRDDLGVPAGTVYVAEDVSHRLRAARIEYQAFHDSLTGLPNRAFFRERLEESIEESDPLPEGPTMALLYIDLDQFKLINDSLGHSMGDRLLQEVASRIRSTLRQEDLICRIAGDEFVALIEARNAQAAETVAGKVVEAIDRPFAVAAEELFITVSVGVANYPEHGEDGDTLLQSADNAMYEAKQEGGNTWKVRGTATADQARRRLTLTNRLHHAMERGELELYFQPIVDLADERVGGAEALLRWRSGDDLRKPVEFLEVAEDTRLIVPMGVWVIEEACRRAASWQGEGEPRRVAVNLSVIQLQEEDLPATVATALDRSGLDPSLLELEVTETAAVKSPRQITTVLERLSELGARIAMDDFGTGYSSLSYLQSFPLDIVKIDQMFTRGIGLRQRETAIIEATLAMARTLGLEVTAEGVENLEQLRLLRERRCPRVQGFAICEPVPERELLRFFARDHPLPGEEHRGWIDHLPFRGAGKGSGS